MSILKSNKAAFKSGVKWMIDQINQEHPVNPFIKVHLSAQVLLQSLDDIEDESGFKHNLKRHGKIVMSEIEKFDSTVFNLANPDDKNAMVAYLNDQLNKLQL